MKRSVSWKTKGKPQAGKVIWFTGLSGSGKTTLAKAVCRKLQAQGLFVEHLDGDEVRALFPQTGFDRDSRNEHIARIGYLASKLEKHGVIVLASFISPYRESRHFTRKLCRNFFEIFLSTPLEVCRRRDPKGLYRKVSKGKIRQFTGVQDPYEPPLAPELILDTSRLSIQESVAKVLQTVFPRKKK